LAGRERHDAACAERIGIPRAFASVSGTMYGQKGKRACNRNPAYQQITPHFSESPNLSSPTQLYQGLTRKCKVFALARTERPFRRHRLKMRKNAGSKGFGLFKPHFMGSPWLPSWNHRFNPVESHASPMDIEIRIGFGGRFRDRFGGVLKHVSGFERYD
jgi:hypothetical protein